MADNQTTPYAPGYCHHADWEAYCAQQDEEQEKRMTQETAESALEKQRRLTGAWLNATADARLELERVRALAVAAAQFLRSPAIHKLRVQGEWLTRDDVVARIVAPQEANRAG